MDSLAQLAEHWIPNPKAIGSSPVWVTTLLLDAQSKEVMSAAFAPSNPSRQAPLSRARD